MTESLTILINNAGSILGKPGLTDPAINQHSNYAGLDPVFQQGNNASPHPVSTGNGGMVFNHFFRIEQNTEVFIIPKLLHLN